MAAAGLDDPFLPLAFSLYSSPGAYAVIAGAGVSAGAGVVTAWEIVVATARQICRARGGAADAESITAETVEDWYSTTFGENLTYSGILERIAPTEYERERALRKFFEPSTAPSAGHRAIARLAKAGVVRVIVTMNFDHLFEAALREVGVEPRVVATESAAEGLPPLHTISECLVVHLHGSYLDGTSMLNTSTELAAYSPQRQELLDTIVGTHGILVVGWSAEHDKALRETLQRKHRKFYTPGWINRTAPKAAAAVLASALGAHVIEATADQAFVRLADAVDAMGARNARHPLTVAVVVDRIKRDLAGHRPAITAHDTFSAEAARLESVEALRDINYTTIGTAELDTRVLAIDEACLVSAAATAVLARWGSEETDEWWMPVLEKWSAAVPTVGGLSRVEELPLMVGSNLYCAAGIAALAGRRYQLLGRLLAHKVETPLRTKIPACRALAWGIRHRDIKRATTNPLRKNLATTLSQALGLSESQLDLLWQQFEVLLVAAQIMSAPEIYTRFDAVTEAESKVAERRGSEAAGMIHHGPTTLQELEKDADREMATLARLAGDHRPHVFVELLERPDQLNRWPWISRVAERLTLEASEEVLTALAAAANRDASMAGWPVSHFTALSRIVLRATVFTFHLSALDLLAGRPADYLWLDTPTA